MNLNQKVMEYNNATYVGIGAVGICVQMANHKRTKREIFPANVIEPITLM